MAGSSSGLRAYADVLRRRSREGSPALRASICGRGDRGSRRPKHVLFADGVQRPRALQHVELARVRVREHETHARVGQLFADLGQHVGSVEVDVGGRLEVDHDHGDIRGGDEVEEIRAEGRCVGEEQRPIHLHDEYAVGRRGIRVGVSFDVDVIRGVVPHPTQRRLRRALDEQQ